VSRPSGPLRAAKKIQLHHGDFAVLAKLEIRNLKHRRAFGRARAAARQLNDDLLGIRIQNHGPYFKRRRKFERAYLEWDCDKHRRASLL
jgi:hypothetical protein